MQVNEGQSLRRELDVWRDDAYKGSYALEGGMRNFALADAVEERNKDLVCEFNKQVMVGGANAESLHTQLQAMEAHIGGIRTKVQVYLCRLARDRRSP